MKTHRLINPNDPKVTAIQSRQHTSLELIEDYAAQMAAGVQFDPCFAIETRVKELEQEPDVIFDGRL